ncbi:hypothetical protein EDD86DRAFT_64015 [Gorgonomyces haynaldii]|nr:hypothetical protein EDD86DRAFT_64015 [Gorgonomyces haynaldii]
MATSSFIGTDTRSFTIVVITATRISSTVSSAAVTSLSQTLAPSVSSSTSLSSSLYRSPAPSGSDSAQQPVNASSAPDLLWVLTFIFCGSFLMGVLLLLLLRHLKKSSPKLEPWQMEAQKTVEITKPKELYFPEEPETVFGKSFNFREPGPPIPHKGCVMVAIQAYKKCKDDEMSFKADDRIIIMDTYADGWYMGKNEATGQFGMVPGNFLVSEEDE